MWVKLGSTSDYAKKALKNILIDLNNIEALERNEQENLLTLQRPCSPQALLSKEALMRKAV